MRREELAESGTAFFDEIARHTRVGYLALSLPDGQVRAIALDFAVIDQRVYFHGALAGEKFDMISTGPKVGFTMVKELSFIPSYWVSPRHACPATHLFKSVEIKGRCLVVEEAGEKAAALQALMKKYQPEGRFDRVKADDKAYTGSIEHVGIFRVDPESWTGKLKVGQNETAAMRHKIIAGLRERGETLDLETADLIEATLD